MKLAGAPGVEELMVVPAVGLAAVSWQIPSNSSHRRKRGRTPDPGRVDAPSFPKT